MAAGPTSFLFKRQSQRSRGCTTEAAYDQPSVGLAIQAVHALRNRCYILATDKRASLYRRATPLNRVLAINGSGSACKTVSMVDTARDPSILGK